MSNDEEHAPSAAASENEDDEAEADSDREQPTRSRKRSKTSLTKVEDLYAVSQRRQALSAKANKGKFAGLRAEKPARANAAPTTKNSGKDFVYGVLFVSLVVFGVQKPLNSTGYNPCFDSTKLSFLDKGHPLIRPFLFKKKEPIPCLHPF